VTNLGVMTPLAHTHNWMSSVKVLIYFFRQGTKTFTEKFLTEPKNIVTEQTTRHRVLFALNVCGMR
jgi:hypothetical protein